ncbi:TPA: AAA family ATPase [Klebsiella quasipneumoniae]
MRLIYVTIEGFWGVKDVSLNFYRDYNFIIGPNGIGKTTVLNLITSVFKVDIDAIAKVQFDRVLIGVIGLDNNLYHIDVIKGIGDDDDCVITFQILNLSNDFKVFLEFLKLCYMIEVMIIIGLEGFQEIIFNTRMQRK